MAVSPHFNLLDVLSGILDLLEISRYIDGKEGRDDNVGRWELPGEFL